jgi:hypothetical protein
VDRQRRPPLSAGHRNIRSTRFVGVYVFFSVRPSRSITNHKVLSAAVVGSPSRNSAKVISGFAVTSGQPLLLPRQHA